MIIVVVGIWVCLGVITGVIADSKGRSFIGWFFFGMALFIVALPCVLLARPSQKSLDTQALAAGGRKCPACAEIVRREARVCRFCGAQLGDYAPPENPFLGAKSYHDPKAS